MPEFEPDARLKDPEKIAASIQAKREEWLEGAALSATTGRVLVVGTLQLEAVEIFEGDEADVLRHTWDLWRSHSTRLWIGHNIKGFDIPFLVRRSWIHDVSVPGDVFEGRHVSSRFKDTMETWACGDYGSKYTKLDTVARALGVGKKSGSGADFARLYTQDREAALEYCRNDLRLTQAVAKKMGII